MIAEPLIISLDKKNKTNSIRIRQSIIDNQMNKFSDNIKNSRFTNQCGSLISDGVMMGILHVGGLVSGGKSVNNVGVNGTYVLSDFG